VISIENEVFNTLATALRAVYNPISIFGEYVKAPPVFPCVTIEEKDNYVYERSQTSPNIENHAGLMYEVNVYSSRPSGRKSECKDIFALIDNVLGGIGFTRTTLNSFSHEEDATVYRMVGRYKAVVSFDRKIYRR